MLRSRLLASVRPFYAAENDQGTENAQDDKNQQNQDDATKDGKNAAGDGTADGGDGSSDGTKPPKKEGEGGEEPPRKPDWRDKEIARKHAQNKEKDRELAEVRSENARLKELAEAAARKDAGAEGGEGGDAGTQETAQPRRAQYKTQADFDSAVKAEAARVASQTQLERDMADTASRGKKDYGVKWDGAMATLGTLGGFDPDTFNGIMATDDPAKVLFTLGNDPDEFQRIMELPPAKRMTELVKLSIAEKKAPQISRAPAPVEGLNARGGGSDNGDLSDDLPEEEWRARRMAIKNKSIGKPWSPKRVA